MRLCFRWTDDHGEHGDVLALDHPVVVGRDAGCDIQIDHPDISRRHLRISKSASDRTPQQIAVEDLSSANGTWLFGVRLQSQILSLPIGNLLLGSSVVVSIDSAPPIRRIGKYPVVFAVVVLLGLAAFGTWPVVQRRSGFVANAKNSEIESNGVPDLPALPSEQLYNWSRAMADDSAFRPGALGMAIRGMRVVAASASPFAGSAATFATQFERTLGERVRSYRYGAQRALAVGDLASARRAAERLRMETASIDVGLVEQSERILGAVNRMQGRWGR